MYLGFFFGCICLFLVQEIKKLKHTNQELILNNLHSDVVSVVVLASPHWSGIGERTPSIVADQIKTMERKIAGFEVVNNSGFETENLFGGLINEEEIQRRLKFLIDRTLQVVKENQ
jgi:hypothetical protein